MAIILDKSSPSKHRAIPLVAIRDGVIFPRTEVVLTFGRPKSVAGVEAAFRTDKQIAFVTQKTPSLPEPKEEDLYKIGTLCSVDRILKTNGDVNALVKGLKRVKLERVKVQEPFMIAVTSEIPEIIEESEKVKALYKHITAEFKKAVNLGKSVEFLNFMKLMSGVEPAELADQVASTLEIKTAEKQALLEIPSVEARLEKISTYLSHEIKVIQIERNIASRTQKKFDKSMRDAVLRERMKTIQKELGGRGEDKEISELRTKIKKLKMLPEARKKSLKELKRLAQMSSHNPESGYIRTWLDTMVEMPWSKRTPNNVSIKKAEKILDEDHYGLKEVKERITEYLAVMTLKKGQKPAKKEKDIPLSNKIRRDQMVPTILCFVGPPGVGKTSIGKSIARALGRKFVKMSLGGIRDEAEIRGHRRTYVGAMPGRIVQGIRTAGSKNPVYMLDEIDKVGTDFRGDPSSALLEALDPEQNIEFSDHYLEVPFDLSEVMFITTANVLDTIPPALRDRLEVIQFSGYTEEEKYQIAKKYLISKTLKSNGLKTRQASIPEKTLKTLIKRYTKEAGVRNLEREISKVFRKIAKGIADKKHRSKTVSKKALLDYLGPFKFSETLAEKKDEAGMATGLAYTQAGGDILFIEVAVVPGKGKLTLTGQLGNVMKESGKAAVSYVRSRWKELKLDKGFYKKLDLHIHVPEGAVPKDGPSAGVTMTTALVSALTDTPTRREVSMTGEVTLRGRVLEIGGVKEKVIAAHRAGLKEIILPQENKKNLVKVPKEVQKDIKFHFVSHMDEVLKIALKKIKGNSVKKSTAKKSPAHSPAILSA